MAFYTIRPKSGTATQWSTANPVLREREIGFEYPDGGLGTGEIKMKMGDGVTAWNDLEYAILPLYIRDGKGNAVYDLSMTPQPNLLDNADFKSGIINQRGEEEYTASNKLTYTVDRWRIRNGKATPQTDSVKYENTSSSSANVFEQKFEELGQGDYTLYVNIKSCTDGTKMTVVHQGSSGTDEVLEEIEIEVGENILTVSGKPKRVQINVPQSGSVEIYQAKLEKGSLFTGMPQWNRVEELNKCLFRFEVRTIVGIALSGNFTQAFGAQEAQYYLATGGFAEKVKVPSVDVKEIDSNSGVVSNLSVNTVQGIKTNGVFSFVLNTSYTRPYLNFKCFIDAEDYS